MTTTETGIVELLPCPFGHAVKRGPHVEVSEEHDFAQAACGDCGACGPYADLPDFSDNEAAKAAAAKLWNARIAAMPDTQVPANVAGIKQVARATGLLASMLAFVREHARGVPFNEDRQGTAIILIDEAAAALEAQSQLLQTMASALEKAAKKFDHYEQLHRLKCTAEGDEKADRNREMADMCAAALRARAQEPSA